MTLLYSIAMRQSLCLIALVLVSSACRGGTVAPTETVLPSVDPSVTATPTKGPPKPPRATRAVFSTGTQIVLYEVGRDRARVVAEGDTVSQPQFQSRDIVTFVSEGGGAGALYRLDLKTGETQELFSVDTGIDTYAVHPDGTEVAFVTRGSDDFPRLRIVTLVDGTPVQSVATLARAQGRGIAPDDQLKISYTPDGSRFVVVYTYADGQGRVPDEQSQLQVRSASGSLEFAAKHRANPTMPTWSADGDELFFVQRGGVRRWSPTSGLDRVGIDEWFNPWTSPDGRRIAFDTGQTEPGARVRVLDLNTGGVQTIGDAGLFNPVFARANLVWAQRLEACTQEDCLYPVHPSNEVVSININTGKTTTLGITKLIGVDVWYERPR